MRRSTAVPLLAGLALLASTPARAFWVLNFSTAQTLDPGQVGFIAGTGGQLTFVGSPAASSYTPFLAHAGIRVGLLDGLDVGYRLVTVPLPYSAVGPTLGSAVDAKLRLTPRQGRWQLALIAGGAFAYLRLEGHDRSAFSPGGALTITHPLGTRTSLTLNARYAYSALPTAPGGAADNHVHSAGGSVALRVALTKSVSIIPEVGLFRFLGAIGGRSADGFGSQYGAVLSTLIP